jgi:phage-related protein
MVLWNNTDFRTKGIIVEKIPTISKGKKKIDVYQIEGRNGFLSVDTGVYEPFEVILECHCADTANLDEVKKFLDGYGTLSFDGLREYTAIIDSTIPFEEVQNFKRFQVNFLVNPIAESKTAQTINLLGLSTFSITTYSNVYPTLTITASGDISVNINGNIFYLTGTSGTYTLDCKNKEIYDSLNANKSGIMNGDFPSFINGTNNISTTGTITAISASYKETYL